LPLDLGPVNGGKRRIFLLAAHPGEGRFTKSTAAVQAWQPEMVFMPYTCRSPSPSGAAQLGGKETFTPDFCVSYTIVPPASAPRAKI